MASAHSDTGRGGDCGRLKHKIGGWIDAERVGVDITAARVDIWIVSM